MIRFRYGGIWLAVISAFFPSITAAYGLSFQANLSSEQAVIIHADGIQEIILNLQLEESEEHAAILFPVPEMPEIDQPLGGTELFAYLAEATKPHEEIVRRVVWQPAAHTAAESVETQSGQVFDHTIIDDYDITLFDHNSAQSVYDWLHTNDYPLPETAQPILADYIAEGWTFVAIHITQADIQGNLAPLRMRFASDHIIYPMRLGMLADQPIELQIYVLTDGRVTMEPLDTLFADVLENLEPGLSTEQTTLLQRASYLTRLRAANLDPQTFTTDLIARNAPTNEPYRAVTTIYEDVSILRQYGLITALLCLIGLNLLTMVIAVHFKRQFSRISPERETR